KQRRVALNEWGPPNRGAVLPASNVSAATSASIFFATSFLGKHDQSVAGSLRDAPLVHLCLARSFGQVHVGKVANGARSGRLGLGCPQFNAASMSNWVFVRISSAARIVTSIQAAHSFAFSDSGQCFSRCNAIASECESLAGSTSALMWRLSDTKVCGPG
ncbi:hypothetical protein M419DRAFT_79053, partial [Trichoderma reesei RUT C-30]